MKFISGEILTTEGIKKGYIKIGKDKRLEIGKGIPQKKPICRGLIIPTLVNSHTHIGDSFIKSKNIDLPKTIEKLVGPPNGLKHRLLRESTDKDIINGMKNSINSMIKNGTQFFCDFRENGILGINQLRGALNKKKINPIILSRPKDIKYIKDEIDLLIKNSDGIAISSISDWEYSELKKIADQTKRKRKIFALHASERIRENIEDILDLKPDFLVHMNKGSESDFIRVKENNVPIVICPRSNNFFGLKPKYSLMRKIGNKLLIGTDNAMLNSPNILDEINFIRKNSNIYSALELIYMVTIEPRKALNLKADILGFNSKLSFVVLNKKSLKPLYISINKMEE